jgi:glycosyltransferase involved in cell wall biosynthesis
MKAARRILFVQHAGSPGGSVMSLRYLVQGLVARGVDVAVAMVEPNVVVRAMYEGDGARVFDTPEIPLYRHTTAGWAHLGDPRACFYQAKAHAKASRGLRVLEALVGELQPDIVHLNSVTLALMARALVAAPTPVVWHVRESPVDGYLGIRRRMLRRWLETYADEVIFLSESDRTAWVDGRRGIVVPNVVPARTAPSADAIRATRAEFGAGDGDRLVAYVGGYQEIKGIFPLVDAVRSLLPDHPRLRILAPGMTLSRPTSWKARLARRVMPAIGLARDYERAATIVEAEGASHAFLRRPFVQDVLPVLAAAEFLVFPSTRPHFARPVVEAATVGRAAVGSRLGGVSDLIEDGRTGLLVRPDDPAALADAMRLLLGNPARAAAMGLAAAELARTRFDADAQIDRVMAIYSDVISRGRASSGCRPAA